MNTLFNSALRQSNAIRKDLDAFQDSRSSSPALLGQINASLASFNRTLEDYNKLAKQEIVSAKQEKAFERLKNFRSEQNDYRDRLTSIRQENEEHNSVAARNELLGRRPHAAATPENPYAHSNLPQNSAFRPGGGANAPTGSAYVQADYTRETHVLRESGFMAQTNAQLDEYLERGRAVLGDLGQQRGMLKNTQRKLYSVANTLGVSGDTIRMVERRAKQDKWIFWTGVVVFFLFCWLVLHYLR